MKKIEDVKKLIETGKISMEDALALAAWIEEKAGKRPSTQSDPGDHPPPPPPHP